MASEALNNSRAWIPPVLEQIGRLAIERLAYLSQCLKAHTLDTPALQQGYVNLRDPDSLGELFRSHFAFREHDVEGHNDGHA